MPQKTVTITGSLSLPMCHRRQRQSLVSHHCQCATEDSDNHWFLVSANVPQKTVTITGSLSLKMCHRRQRQSLVSHRCQCATEDSDNHWFIMVWNLKGSTDTGSPKYTGGPNHRPPIHNRFFWIVNLCHYS